ERVATAMVVAVLLVLGLSTFWETLTVTPDWQMGDWGPQHAVLARVMPGLPGLHTPVWNHAVGTGDAPMELYPKLAYVVTGNAAGLLAAAAALVALAAVALLASDVPPRRALAAMGHVAIGIALGAAAWMPLAARILEYGQHFPNPLRTPARLLEDLLAQPSP